MAYVILGTLRTRLSGDKTCAASLENVYSEFPTRSDTNRTVQPQKMTKGLKVFLFLCDLKIMKKTLDFRTKSEGIVTCINNAD